jgi:molybdenum cofactor cytidylyltransferase
MSAGGAPHAGELAAVVLAAGSSSRLGEPKQLVELEGEKLIARVVRLAFEAGAEPVVVVLGDRAELIAAVISHFPVTIVRNEQWQTGMGSSLRAGIRKLTELNPLPQNALVLVCDQPMLDLKLLQTLAATHLHGDSAVTAARYAETLGVPAIFRSELYVELTEVDGDRGARSVVQRHHDRASAVSFAGGAVDIDLPQDLLQLRKARRTTAAEQRATADSPVATGGNDILRP